MNYNNFKNLYFNINYSNLNKNKIKAKTLSINKKHNFITAGLKYDLEYIKIKGVNTILDDSKYIIEKWNDRKYNIINEFNNNISLKYKKVENNFLKKYTNAFSFSYTKLVQNVLVGNSGGKLCVLLKKPENKGLLISLKKRECFHLIRCKYLINNNRWLLVIDNVSHLFKIIKAILGKRVYSSLDFKIIR